MSKGWISIHRKMQDHWLWFDKPFSRGQAWIDILFMVNHQDNEIALGNELTEVKRGSRITSEVKLAERWGWSRTKVRGFLSLLEKDKMITKKADNRKTTLTVVNYDDYQFEQTAKEQQKNIRKTAKEQQKNTNNNVKNVKNETYSEFVKKVLRNYPGKKSKSIRDKKLPGILKEYGEDKVLQCIKRYAKSVKGVEQQFILHESTFWNTRYIDFMVEDKVENKRPPLKKVYREL